MIFFLDINNCRENQPKDYFDTDIVLLGDSYLWGVSINKPFDIVTNTDSEKTCSICLELIGDVECRLKCGHGYHYNCIKEWAHTQRNNNCPQCRSILIEV